MEEAMRRNNQKSIFEIFWSPVAGFISFITLCIQTYKLWLGNQAEFIIATALGSGTIFLVILIWFSFSNTSLFPEIYRRIFGSDTDRVIFPYIKTYARIGLCFYIIVLLVVGNAIYQRRQDLIDKTIILVSSFDGPEETYGITNELLEKLNQSTSNFSDISVIPLKETIKVEDGSDYARKIGRQRLADIVVWGWYRPTANPNITLHLENLNSDYNTLFSPSTKISPSSTLDELESFISNH